MKHIEVDFPVIADLTMGVAKKYGMLQPSANHLTSHNYRCLASFPCIKKCYSK